MPTWYVTFKTSNKAKLLRELPTIKYNTMIDIGAEIIKYIQRDAPVDTGELKYSYSMRIDMNDSKLTIGSMAEHAPYVELGTGPNYEYPPDWVINNAKRGHHLTDPWWYIGDDGEWHEGWFVVAQPHLRPAFLGHVDQYKQIFKRHLQKMK